MHYHIYIYIYYALPYISPTFIASAIPCPCTPAHAGTRAHVPLHMYPCPCTPVHAGTRASLGYFAQVHGIAHAVVVVLSHIWDPIGKTLGTVTWPNERVCAILIFFALALGDSQSGKVDMRCPARLRTGILDAQPNATDLGLLSKTHGMGLSGWGFGVGRTHNSDVRTHYFVDCDQDGVQSGICKNNIYNTSERSSLGVSFMRNEKCNQDWT